MTCPSPGRVRLSVAVLMFALLVSPPAYGQAGSFGGVVRSLAIDLLNDDVVYAGTEGGPVRAQELTPVLVAQGFGFGGPFGSVPAPWTYTFTATDLARARGKQFPLVVIQTSQFAIRLREAYQRVPITTLTGNGIRSTVQLRSHAGTREAPY